ncbi:hypothetical protein [Streptomyces griseorubiginosus]|uniref:hypothetical protein n=1 Tax=Streptomyces griseorubiginosus TaxID=67304 RepID=UPI001AD6F4BD|nr:hypothetical protein [Streptomyces griseorubiginosus]MBO4260568.1 hypothetical protein [Streptomyces griseorubiginosus]
MDLEKRAPQPRESEGCLVVVLRVPVRIVVFVLVVPVRMVWDALVVAGRFLRDTVLRPVGRVLAWIGRALFVWPFVGLWRYVVVPVGRVLGWLGNVIVVVPMVWLGQYVVVPLGRAVRDALAWVYARVLLPVLVPLGRAVVWCAAGLVRGLGLVLSAVGTVLYWVGRVLIVLPALALWRWVLAPVGRVLAVVGREVGEALGHAWRVAGRVSLAVGRALGTLFRWIFVEPVRWFWRTVLTPVGQVVRDAVLRPVAAVARGVGRVAREALASARESVRQARADVRRMLFGEPARVPSVDRREPLGAETRTLGSSTTALTKD